MGGAISRPRHAIARSAQRSSSGDRSVARVYQIAASEFATTLVTLRRLIETDLAAIEREAETAWAPWTPGRLPDWKPE